MVGWVVSAGLHTSYRPSSSTSAPSWAATASGSTSAPRGGGQPDSSLDLPSIDSADEPLTLLLDEVDILFGLSDSSSEQIRDLLNSGFKRGWNHRAGSKQRGFAPEAFDVFAPSPWPGWGGLPDTLLSRSVVVPMRKRLQHERVEAYRPRQVKPLAEALRAGLGSGWRTCVGG